MTKIETPRHEYKVVVRDNFHYMDEDAHYELGTFATYEAALTACREIVDGSFRADWADDVTADEMFNSYAMFGEDPVIIFDGLHCDFSAWDYARLRCEALCKSRGEPP